ncbi:MAG TPA: hypothetical protein VMX74_05515 [Pirellulales bacterium]|nr:hypothetical protein [Pirellulales bacterium]
MRTAFADTYFYLALVSGDDAGHNKAAEFAATWNGRTITTAWVLTEIADALVDPSQRPKQRGQDSLLGVLPGFYPT